MLLTDQIILTIQLPEIKDIYARKVLYKMLVHNYDSTHILFSLERTYFNSEGYSRGNSLFVETEEHKIPHELTAKDWLAQLIILREPFLQPDYKEDNSEGIEEFKRVILKELNTYKTSGGYMLLCEQVSYTLNFGNFGISEEIPSSFELLGFKYVMYVHNYNATHALISVHKSSITEYNGEVEDCVLIEYEELKIPQEITAKDWIVHFILKYDKYISGERDEGATKIKESLSMKHKIKVF